MSLNLNISILCIALLMGAVAAEGQDVPERGEREKRIQELREQIKDAEVPREHKEKEMLDEPNAIDQQIAFHVQKLADEERAKRMDFMAIVIDDIVRLCHLSDVQQKRLVLAAKGASERSMRRWHEQADRYFRTRVSGADADTAREILSNIGSVNFGGRGSDREGEVESIWKDSLADVLDAKQIETYNQVVEARSRAKIEAFSLMSIAYLDNYLRLTPEQKNKLAPIVSASAEAYLDEIQRYWGDYLEKNMLMSLANAADEKTLTQILSAKQYSRLRTATSNLEHFWDQRRRLKKAKEEAARRKAEKKLEAGQQAEAVKVGGGGRVVIKAGANGAVKIQPGAIFRGGNITIESGDVTISE